jgi:hypothetical protein
MEGLEVSDTMIQAWYRQQTCEVGDPAGPWVHSCQKCSTYGRLSSPSRTNSLGFLPLVGSLGYL